MACVRPAASTGQRVRRGSTCTCAHAAGPEMHLEMRPAISRAAGLGAQTTGGKRVCPHACGAATRGYHGYTCLCCAVLCFLLRLAVFLRQGICVCLEHVLKCGCVSLSVGFLGWMSDMLNKDYCQQLGVWMSIMHDGGHSFLGASLHQHFYISFLCNLVYSF